MPKLLGLTILVFDSLEFLGLLDLSQDFTWTMVYYQMEHFLSYYNTPFKYSVKMKILYKTEKEYFKSKLSTVVVLVFLQRCKIHTWFICHHYTSGFALSKDFQLQSLTDGKNPTI